MSDRDTAARKGRQAALVIAGTAVFWILVTLIGDKEGFSQGLRLVFDLLALAGHSVTPVFITIDPARDTPEVMGGYVQNFSDKMIGLSGSAAQVKAAADAYRVFYSKADDDPEYYLMNHSVFTYLMMPDTGFTSFFRRDESPQQVADQVACTISAS